MVMDSQGEPQFSLQRPNHYLCCTKGHKYHARIGPRFTGFTPALHATGDFRILASLSLFGTESTALALLDCKGCNGDLPWGGGHHFRQQTPFVVSAATV